MNLPPLHHRQSAWMASGYGLPRNPRKRPRPMRAFLIVVLFVVAATALTVLPVLIAFLLRWAVSKW